MNSGVRWTAQKKRCGRKKGVFKLSDDQLREAMSEYTRESSRWSRLNDCVMRHLPMSKRRLASTIKGNGTGISRRHLARRMARGKLGIGVGHERSDDCQVPTMHGEPMGY